MFCTAFFDNIITDRINTEINGKPCLSRKDKAETQPDALVVFLTVGRV